MTTDHPQKITFGEMRESGVRDVLVYCRDHHCSHCVRISADFWPDHLRLSDIEDRVRVPGLFRRNLAARSRTRWPRS